MTPPSRVPGRSARLPIVLAGVCLAAVACGGRDIAGPPPAQQDRQAVPPPAVVERPRPALGDIDADGVLAMPGQAQDAFTYNPAMAPPGGEISVAVEESDDTTEVRIEVDELLPDHDYSARVHTQPCGRTAEAAGPQLRNEVAIDLRTDDEGAGEASTEVPFMFRDRTPASVVLHDGDAGSRLACLNVPFDQLASG